ncbi:MAG: aspartate kinase [Candidatus Levybacteria bacterium]|nr:aspartate kinase [Candidatus Levybacteria bacterium]
MIVAKFGGTSVSSPSQIKTIYKIVLGQIHKKPVVVVSAISGVTDLLFALGKIENNQFDETIFAIKDKHINLIDQVWKNDSVKKEIISYIDEQIKEIKILCKKNKFNKACLDKLASYGEIMSSFIVACYFNKRGLRAKQVIASDIITTNDDFGSAEFLHDLTKTRIDKILKPIVQDGVVPVVTGFIGSTISGKTTTLGRGGSDYSASIIGLCLDAKEVQIWTDVDGVFTADPRCVRKAKLIPSISYREASELASFGARVLHPRTIKPAIKANIPVKVLNTFNPKSVGTLIIDKVDYSNPITAIAFKRKVSLVNIYSTEMLLRKGFLVKVFSVFAKNNISVDLVSVSEVSISVTLDNDENLPNAQKEIAFFAGVSVMKNYSTISLIGESIANSPTIIKDIFNILSKDNIQIKMISLGATDINIGLVIDSQNLDRAVNVLHDKLLMKHRIRFKTKEGQIQKTALENYRYKAIN